MTTTSMGGHNGHDDMTLHSGQSCLDCIDRHVGPALHEIAKMPIEGKELCGGCGRVTTKWRFTYWFPWAD